MEYSYQQYFYKSYYFDNKKIEMNNTNDSAKKSQECYRMSLRSSSQFLSLHMLRASLSSYNHFNPSISLSPTSSHNLTHQKNINQCFQMKRMSALHALKNYNIQQSAQDNITPSKLKQTLQSLQSKIDEAQRILRQPTQKRNKKKTKTNKQYNRIEYQFELQLPDLDQVSTNKQYDEKNINNQSKLSSISKNESIRTLKTGRVPSENQRFFKNFKQYYISSILNMNKPDADPRIKQHINLSFDVLRKLGNCQGLQQKQLAIYKVNLPYNSGKKTILLDIDDTILNCDDEKVEGKIYDFQLEIQSEDGSTFPAYIKLRPYALTFLRNISKIYEIIAFTGSIQKYAKKVIEQIDPDSQIFNHKLYRDSCFEICSGVYVKDIRIINRRPENIVLIDNSPYSYIYQLQNGIPIIPYDNGPDEQLLKLQKYLISIQKCPDLRQINKNTFKFHRYSEFEDVNQMIACLYQGNNSVLIGSN